MTPLHDYLRQIRQAISAFAGVQVEQYREQLLTATRANLRIRLHLADNSFLEISEALVSLICSLRFNVFSPIAS